MLIKNENVIYTPIQNSAEELDIARKAIDENPILSEVLGVLVKQTAKGLAKYPNTVNVDDYTAEEWINHAVEEGIDKVVYLTAFKHKTVELEDENKRLRDALNVIAWHVEASNPQAMIMKDTARKALRRSGEND